MAEEQVGSGRYSYHKSKTTNFGQASVECSNIGKSLAAVKNGDDWRELTSYEESEQEYGYWWLGARKEEGDAEFRWPDGDVFQKFSPNVSISGDSPGNRCLALYSHASLNKVRLYSMPCNQHMYYICGDRSFEKQVAGMENITEGMAITTEATTLQPPLDSFTAYELEFAISSPPDYESTRPSKSDKLFPVELDANSDPGLWMFVALFLALLLVVALVIIVMLWTDRIKRQRERSRNGTRLSDIENKLSAEMEMNQVHSDVTSPVLTSSTKVEEKNP